MQERYASWRRRWLHWQARSLVINALLQEGEEQEAYLTKVRGKYLAYGDFQEEDIEALFSRCGWALRRLQGRQNVKMTALRALGSIQAQGRRLETEASALLERR